MRAVSVDGSDDVSYAGRNDGSDDINDDCYDNSDNGSYDVMMEVRMAVIIITVMQ